MLIGAKIIIAIWIALELFIIMLFINSNKENKYLNKNNEERIEKEKNEYG